MNSTSTQTISVARSTRIDEYASDIREAESLLWAAKAEMNRLRFVSSDPLTFDDVERLDDLLAEAGSCLTAAQSDEGDL